MPVYSDITYMQHALRLAARGLGRTAPNPAVGAVVVKNGVVLGTGVTARGGRPHAEPQALAMAGDEARGATLYVTLEPCSHYGKNASCAQGVIDAGIVRVVVACRDSNPLVGGRGLAMLREAGISVEEGICEAEARRLNEGFFSVIERGRPFVSLKIATSQDGRTVTSKEEGRWITGEAARAHGHLLRATHDAILTGIGTALADDPELTCRLPGREGDSPQRVLLDSSLRLPPTAKLLPCWIVTLGKPDPERAKALEAAGARILSLPKEGKTIRISKLLQLLASEGVTRLLVEGGKSLTESFLRENLADRIYWFRSSQVIGEESSILHAPAAPAVLVQKVGQDSLEIYERN